MHYRFTPITADEIQGTELRMKFLYFLVDLGIKSAKPAAIEAFKVHMDLLAELTVGG